MVVGRRHVAAASVATAYALHVYVLQHHFRPPQTDRPSLPLPAPHCRKVGVQRSRSGYFSWVLVLLPLSLSPPPSLSLDPSDRSVSLTSTLSIHRDPFNPPSSRIYFSRIRTFFLALASDARKAPDRTASHRTTYPLPTLVYPCLSIHCSHSLSFIPTFYLFCSCYSFVSVPHSSLCPK